jgi:hypothetical protein
MKHFIIYLILTSNIYGSEKLAIEKIQQFGKILKTELKAGLKKSPEAAVETCYLKAPEIQNTVSDKNITIGRVSLKNRNPNNSPKKWMLDYIDQFHQKKIKKAYITTKLEHNKTGLLKPIRTMPLCLKCHGSNIDKALYKIIKKKYPNDKAIGYETGEIRGFFWAEY